MTWLIGFIAWTLFALIFALAFFGNNGPYDDEM